MTRRGIRTEQSESKNSASPALTDFGRCASKQPIQLHPIQSRGLSSDSCSRMPRGARTVNSRGHVMAMIWCLVIGGLLAACTDRSSDQIDRGSERDPVSNQSSDVRSNSGTAASSNEVSNQMKQLSKSEITTLIIGKPFAAAIESDRAVFHSETLLPDGTAILKGDRAPVRGRYEIADNVVCISFRSGDRRCSRFYQDSTGALFQESTDAPGHYRRIVFL
jgi:hypothetical protein